MVHTLFIKARVLTTLALIALLIAAVVPAHTAAAARPLPAPGPAPASLSRATATPHSVPLRFKDIGWVDRIVGPASTGDTMSPETTPWFQPPANGGEPLLFEQFSADVFGSGGWTRSDTSVSVDTAHGWLRIGADNGVDDCAEKAISLTLPVVVETRMRLVGGGVGYRLPWFGLYYGPTASDVVNISYASPSWMFKEWTSVQTKGPAAENVWVTVQAVIRSDGGELQARYDTDATFTFVMTRSWSIPTAIKDRVQPTLGRGMRCGLHPGIRSHGLALDRRPGTGQQQRSHP